ncbi:MAG: hypothetical protein ACXW6T_26310, partial [Candidatus Binatia bacterium]
TAKKGTLLTVDVQRMVGFVVHRPHLHHDVIPAKAGIHPEMVQPAVGSGASLRWTPAFTGVTG